MIGSNETSSYFPISIERFLARLEPSYLRFSRAARIDLCAKKGTEKVSARRFFGLFSVSKIFVPSFRLSRSRLNGRGVNESRLTRPNAEERVALIGALHWFGGTRAWERSLITKAPRKFFQERLNRRVSLNGSWRRKLEKLINTKFSSLPRTNSARVKPRLVNEYL